MSMEVRLSREMKLLDITMIGVGAMIGAGIFVLTGIAAGVAGPALFLVFGLNGFVALLTAMAYAELGSAIHGAGGGYLWIKASLPDPAGFLSGWMDWFAHAVACSLYALGFGAYFRLVLESFGVPDVHLGFMSLEKWLAVVVCALFSTINIRGASETGKAGNVVTVGKILIIGAFIGVGLWVMFGRPDWQPAFHPFLSHGWGGVFAAMGLTFIAFEGYEIIAQTSEEVENPKRNVPRAMFLSLLIVVPIYLLVAIVSVGAVRPPEGMAITAYLAQEKEVALVSAASQFVTGGGVVLLIGGLLSTLSALNATIYSSSRVAFAMARDANLPQFLGKVHPRYATPYVAISMSTALVVLMAVLLPIESVAASADIMFLLLFAAVNVAVIRLRKSRPELDRGFRVPFIPLIPIVAIGAMLFLAVFLFTHYPVAWLAVGVWIVGGVGVYRGYSSKSEAAFEEREAWMERIERKEYSVLVAVSSPRTLESLMEMGIAIAKRHNGRLVVMTVAEVPEGESLHTGRRTARELQPLLESAVAYATERGVEARGVVKIARRVTQGVVSTAREEGCNFLVIGRSGAHSIMERIVASIVERVLRDAPCQVGVVYGKVHPENLSQIAVPITEGRNSLLAAELGPELAAWYKVPLRPITIVDKGLPKEEAERQVAGAERTLKEAGLTANLEVLRRSQVAWGLARAMTKGTLLVMGAPSGGDVTPIVGETVPAVVAKRGRNPVLVVRDVEPQRSHRFERLFFRRD